MKENINKSNIMIVDDTQGNLDLLSRILIKENYDVQIAVNGEEALGKIELKLPDLILLDINMPVMDGFETCIKIKSNPKFCDIPVLFLSALSEPSDKLKAFDAGGVDYIEKPFNKKEVLARVSTHLRIRSLQQQLQIRNIRLKENVKHLRNAYNQIKRQDENWRQDLLKAQNIQLKILPQSFPPITGLDVCAFYSPSTIVGGDFFDTIEIDENRTAIFLSDVSGHGIAAAMVTVIIHEYIQSIKHLDGDLKIFSSPVKALEYFNHTICEEPSLYSMHVTMVFAVIDSKNKTIEIASAGHPKPFLINSEQKHFLDIETSQPLGFDSSTSFKSSSFAFPENSILLLYTDGLIEAQNSKGIEFDITQLMQEKNDEHYKSALNCCTYIENNLLAHLDKNLPLDDISFLVIHSSKLDMKENQTGIVKIYRHENRIQQSTSHENHISFALDQDNIVIRTMGRLDWHYANPLKKFVSSTEQVKKKSIFIDLSQCTYMDSTMLGTLYQLSKHVKMYNAHDRLLDQLKELGINNIIDFVDFIPSISNFKLLRTQKVDIKNMGNLILEAHKALSDINTENSEKFAGVINTLQDEID